MSSESETVTGRPENIRAVPVRHPGRWVAVAVIAVLAAMLIHMLLTNPNLEWSTVRKYLFSQIILRGVWMTIKLTVLSMAIGIALGIVAAVMRLSANPVVRSAAWLYVWFFRGTPLLVQILVLVLDQLAVQDAGVRGSLRSALRRREHEPSRDAIFECLAGAEPERRRLHVGDRPGGNSVC